MNPCTHPPRRGGFALILSLGLMALMVLLAVSLSALISVESESSRQMRDTALAKQNAYTAMLLGLGQLQLYAGNDQRVTARADILDSGSSTVSNLANPLWTGVWATADDNFATQTLSHYASGGSKNTNAIRQAAKIWLVSGNTSTSTLSPTTTISGQSVTLAGPNSVNYATDYVKAPLMGIPASNTFSADKYAWWISDEGVKGNIAFEQATSATLSLWQYHQYPMKNGSAVLRAGSNSSGTALFEDITTYTEKGVLSNLRQLNIVGAATSTVSKELFHDATTDSRGLMVDVKNGGLRKDMSDYTHIPYADDEPMIDKSMAGTPSTPVTWGQLKSFLRIASTLSAGADGSASISAMAQGLNNYFSKYQHGVYPVVARVAVYYDAAFLDMGSGRYQIRLFMFPMIALWNPYDVTINPAKYSLAEWSNTDNRKIQFVVGRWDSTGHWQQKPMLGKNAKGIEAEDPNPRVYTIDYSLITNTSSSDGMNILYLVDNSTGLAPGEVRVFTAKGTTAYKKNSTANVLQQGFRPGTGFYIDLKPESTASATSSGFTYYTPYVFKTDTSFPIEECRIDLGNMLTSGSKNEEFIHEWFYLSNTGTSTDKLVTVAGLNRAGLAYSIPTSTTSYGLNTWTYTQDKRPKAFKPTIRNSGDTSAMPSGLNIGENAENSLDDFPAYGFVYELKDAFNDQNSKTQEFRRRWLANFNPRAPKFYTLPPLGTDIGQINQNYIGQLRGRSDDLNENQSNLYYTPVTLGADNSLMYFGYSTQGGPQKTILFHLPRPDVPLSGVGDLMHMNVTSYFQHLVGYYYTPNMVPAYVIGNSLADPHLPEGQLYKDYATGKDTVRLYDYSYLLNDALWDKYFSSTDMLDGKGPRDKRFVPATLTASTTTYSGSETPYDYAATRWVQEGAFNINSTSEKAWQMMLASTFNTQVAKEKNETLTISDKAQFLRTGLSFGDVFAGIAENDENAYQGLRALSEDEITTLSRQIVSEVKRRGPFYSVAEFVNRTVDSNAPNDYHLKGPLQAAIDATTLNSSFTEKVNSGSATDNDPIANYPNPDALYGSVGTGLPGFFTQADLLQKIGNRLSARSDTFKIRAYGEFAETGGPTSRAWCEAVVQRVADYVNPDKDKTIVFPPTDADNKSMGRRFIIRSFRWLSPDEI